MSFTRIKDRPIPIQPSNDGVKLDPIIKKKVNNIILEDFQWDENVIDTTPVPMDPYRTTKRRIVKQEISTQDKKYRQENSPCIVDMLKMREIYLKQKAEEDRKEAARLKRRNLQMEQMKKLEDALKNGNVDSLEFDLGEDAHAEMSDGENDEPDEDDEEFKKMALFMKERRIVRQMQSNLMHIPLTNWKIFKYAFDAAFLGGKRFEPFTEILPWLYIGRGSVAKEERFFKALGFTHIMNCTREIPNFFTTRFIYQRIPIDDNINEDAGSKFFRAIEFLSRVFRCKGKVYVHCTMGASRAPTMVMAYLIARRQISLLDSYLYLQSLRSIVQPNPHFLYQLAELEIQQGLGSSVIYRKEWRQYEFNAIRPQIEVYRKPEGIFKTSWKLHTLNNAKLDYLPETEDND